MRVGIWALFVVGCLSSSPAYAAVGEEKVDIEVSSGQTVKVSPEALKQAFARFVRHSRQFQQSQELEILGIPVCYVVTDEGDRR